MSLSDQLTGRKVLRTCKSNNFTRSVSSLLQEAEYPKRMKREAKISHEINVLRELHRYSTVSEHMSVHGKDKIKFKTYVSVK